MADKIPADAEPVDVKKPSDAAALEAEDLDQVSGGAVDSFIKYDMLNPQPLPP